VLDVDSVALTKALVIAGYGYTILTYSSVHDEVSRGVLQARVIERPPLVATLSIVRLREERSPRLARELVRTVREVLRNLVEDGTWKGVVKHGQPSPRGARNRA
jgi:LysR family nitrogen assimilation transcriptional regulator